MSAAALPTEIVQTILVAGVRDKHSGKPFGAQCLRVSKWVALCIIPELYHTADLWNEVQAASFLLAIQSNDTHPSCQPRHYVRSVIINTAAFNAYDAQPVQSNLPQLEVGRLTPGGATTMTTFAILSCLSQCDSQWTAVTAPMVILATRRYPPPPPIIMPRDVTITGVDSISWGAYNWDNVERIRFTSYNPNLQEARWLAALPKLSHIAFAFYYDVPLGLNIVEELASSQMMQCVLVVVYWPHSRVDQGVKEHIKKSLQKLDEPKLVVWRGAPNLVNMLETEEIEPLWKEVEGIVLAQTAEKRAALLQ